MSRDDIKTILLLGLVTAFFACIPSILFYFGTVEKINQLKDDVSIREMIQSPKLTNFEASKSATTSATPVVRRAR